MGEELKSLESRKTAINYQEKTYFFIVSLLFTTLAFSIQTAKFNGSFVSQLSELVAWVCLFVSGLSGLFNLICTPRIYNLYANRIDCLYNIQYTNPEQKDKDLDKIQGDIKKLTKVILRTGIIQMIFGILGFIALIIARGYDPFKNIFW